MIDLAALHQPVPALSREAAQIIWSYPVAAPLTPDRIILEGEGHGEAFAPRAATPVQAGRPDRPGLVPIGQNILSDIEPQVFGREERIGLAKREGRILLECRAGDEVAGVILRTPGLYLPRGMNGVVVLKGSATNPLQLSIVEAGRDAPVGGQVLFHGQAELPLPATGGEIVMVCPGGAATASIASLVIQPRPLGPDVLPRGTWIWEPDAWMDAPEKVAASARAAGLSEAALQFRVSRGSVEGAGAASDALSAMSARGLRLLAVEGDPAMVEEEGLRNAVARVEVLRRFNGTLPEAARLAGLELDIEPYMTAAYRANPPDTWRTWARAVAELSAAWGGPVSVVVPFWMLDQEGAEQALGSVRERLSSVVVMAYRTGAQELVAASEPLLAWGGEHRVPVRVAIETGPIAEEVHRTYVRAAFGDLVLRRSASGMRAELLSSPVAASEVEPVYAYSHQVTVEPARITFGKDAARAARVEAEALPILRSWPAFSGLRIHAALEH